MVGKHPIVLDKPIFPYSHDLLVLHTRWEVISPYYIPIIYVHYIYTGHGSPCKGYIVTCPSRCWQVGGGAAAALRRVVAAAAVVVAAPGAAAADDVAVGDAWRWRHFWVNLGINGNMDGLE